MNAMFFFSSGPESAAEGILGTQTLSTFQTPALGEFGRLGMVDTDAVGVRSSLHPILGHRGFWINRLLPDVPGCASSLGFRAQPYDESRNGSLFGAAGEGGRGPRPRAYAGAWLLAHRNAYQRCTGGRIAVDRHSLDQVWFHSSQQCQRSRDADWRIGIIPMARQFLSKWAEDRPDPQSAESDHRRIPVGSAHLTRSSSACPGRCA